MLRGKYAVDIHLKTDVYRLPADLYCGVIEVGKVKHQSAQPSFRDSYNG